MTSFKVFALVSVMSWPRGRWTRREQADFYRTVSSYGVVFDPERKAFDWTQFRALARLERKTDPKSDF
ncbi:Chromodomain-helicase-DNA-binding protein 6 [Liparis tanakae]|uniref:Chromodomain-helicase-DNA-binding protein 6 n=1 Tax=Liparis tanakae TaxID=230148 RepID=A0A4Z2E459_9TELE|nr:Chromodomain-helicase-DNA-binding protein 6 [Liparis tanakae]